MPSYHKFFLTLLLTQSLHNGSGANIFAGQGEQQLPCMACWLDSQSGSGKFDTNRRDFHILMSLFVSAEIEEYLGPPAVGGLENVPLFAPIDRAFFKTAKLLNFSGDYDEEKISSHLVSELRKYGEARKFSSPDDALKFLLLYHFAVKNLRVRKLRKRGRIRTKYNGTRLRVRRAKFGKGRAKLVDTSGSRCPCISARNNVQTLNGYVHAVKDYMLVPFSDLESLLNQEQGIEQLEEKEELFVHKAPARPGWKSQHSSE